MVSYCSVLDTKLLAGVLVLILVVMEDGLVQQEQQPTSDWHLGLNPCCNGRWSRTQIIYTYENYNSCLNPCCNGRWSRTRPYKTILIISKLKNFTKQILTFLNRKLTIP